MTAADGMNFLTTQRPELATVAETAELTRLSEDTLSRLRKSADGPPFLRVGKRVLYARDGLRAWAAERIVNTIGEKL